MILTQHPFYPSFPLSLSVSSIVRQCATQNERIDDLIIGAMQDYHTDGGETFLLRIYNLLGDPALQIKP